MTRWQKFACALASLVLAGGIMLSATVPSLAQRPTEDQILNALKPAPNGKTRGLTAEQSRQSAEEQRFINTIRSIKTRQLTLDERQKVSDIAKSKPSIDLEVYFAYNSSAISPRAKPDLMALGRALTSPDLKGGVFLVGGHTDSKGTDQFNQKLSEQRAAAVKHFLKEQFDIPDDTLVTAGYGKQQLKSSSDPFSAENRRVQIVNLEQKTAGR
jgi:outer membrane protein OmpA-like peptidoglycan-associated protein